MEIDRIRLPFQEQIEFFRKKLNLPTERWDDILKSAHDRAFIVAGAMNADLLDDLRKAVDAGIAGGDTLADFRKKFKAIVQKHGWSGWTGEGTKAGEAWRTKVIYNTNISSSYAAGRWHQLNDPELLKVRPYWRYIHNDSTLYPRQQHQAWGNAGLTLPHDHPFWKLHFPPQIPPNWGCRCRVKAVRRPGEGDATTPPDGWRDVDAKFKNQDLVEQGWNFAPGANATTPLREMIDRKLMNLEAPIGAAMWKSLKPALAMERELAWWKTLDTWVADEYPRGRHFVLGALSQDTLTWMDETLGRMPPSAEIVVFDKLPKGAKQRRHEAGQNGLTLEEWRTLPSLLDKPGAIYYDRHSGNLIFVADGIGPIKSAIEFAPKETRKLGDANQIVTAFRINDKDVAGAVSGGEWKVVEVAGTRVGVEPT